MIKIYNDLNAAELVRCWRLLDNKIDSYAQMSYDWISAWHLAHLSVDKFIIGVKILEGRIITILPLGIYRRFGVKQLRNVPDHFGDFFRHIGSDEWVSDILDVILSSAKVDCVEFKNINNKSLLYEILAPRDLSKKYLSNIIYTKTGYGSIEELLDKLKSKERKNLKRRLRKLKETGQVRFLVVQDPKEFRDYSSVMDELYIRRWKLKTSRKVTTVLDARREAFSQIMGAHNVRCYLLFLDDKLIGYRLGFVHNSIFISWKLVYDNDYSSFGIGYLLSYFVIEDSISNKIMFINNGAGDYTYKLRWFESEVASSNFSFSSSITFKGLLYKFILNELKKISRWR